MTSEMLSTTPTPLMTDVDQPCCRSYYSHLHTEPFGLQSIGALFDDIALAESYCGTYSLGILVEVDQRLSQARHPQKDSICLVGRSRMSRRELSSAVEDSHYRPGFGLGRGDGHDRRVGSC
jgi:hypothetical protein